MPRRRSRSGFGSRLLGAQALVLVAGAVTTWAVAAVVGPGLFREHLSRAGVSPTSAEAGHLDEAFTSSLAISISIALVAATVTALAVTWFFSQRVQRSLREVVTSATQVAAGQYDARVGDPGLGREFAVLASTSNALAQRLEAAERARRQMLADLAHEMRTPLATIDAHLEAIEDGVRLPDQETLDVLRLSSQRLRRLAQDIAAVSRADERPLDLAPRPIPARTLALAAVQAASERFDAAGVDLRAELDTDAQILADADRIGQVLGNVLDNALRHTPAGGTVRVTCARHGSWVEYAVRDTGHGIAPEHLDQVFQRFWRADASRHRGDGGSGIGLSIAKSLVEAHGGEVSAVSEGRGRGAEFRIRLPVV